MAGQKSIDQVERGHSDWFILLGVLGMMFFSVAFVYSASSGFAEGHTGSAETFFWSHLIRIVAGVAVLLVFARIDYHWLERWSKPLLVLALGMLVYVLFEGTRIKGATRWIDFGIVSFQPSELAKFALVAHLGVLLAEKRKYIDDFKFAILPMILWIGVILGLVALQPNYSTALVIALVALGTLFLGGVRVRHLAMIVLPGILAAGLYAGSADYRMDRIAGFLGMHSGETTMIESAGYQLRQGLLAFGSGGVVGVGPGQSRQRLFLPEPFGDFIYAIIGEEYGFIGAVLLLGIFGMIIWRGLLVAQKAPDDLGRSIAGGITIAIGLYALVNAGVTTGVLPTTGLPMPFVSYGGSSVLFSAAAVGILLNISRSANVMPFEKRDLSMAGGHA